MRRQASAIAREAELPKNSFPPGQSIIFKGMLQKKAGFLGKKKFRMFVLTKEWLGYYDMSSGVTLKGSIPLTEITNISEGEKDPNVFNIHSSRKVGIRKCTTLEKRLSSATSISSGRAWGKLI
eukprot:g10115.t1